MSIRKKGVRCKLGGEYWSGNLKSTIDCAAYYTLMNLVTMKLCAQMGNIHTQKDTVHYSDRFFLGGMRKWFGRLCKLKFILELALVVFED